MSDSGLPAEVRRLIVAHLDSAQQLEILLTLRKSDGRAWKPDAVSRELRTDPASTAASLRHLADAGLLRERDGEYTFEPANRSLAAGAEALADAYAKRRVRVIEFLYNKPSETIVTLADAFNFRRKK